MTRQERTRIARWMSGTVAATFALISAGCTAGPTGDPSNPTTTSSSDAPLPSSRPPIPRSLDATTYRDKPCELFSDDQARMLGILESGATFQKPESADCQRFSSPPGENDLVVSYYFASDLLARIYRGDTNWPTKQWTEPLNIAGQPAVKTTLPATDNCRLAIGLTDNQGVEIQVRYKRADACPRALQVAETIVHNLGG
jgi:hypothetical protein